MDGKKCVDVGDEIIYGGTAMVLKDCDANSTTQYFGWDATTHLIYATPEKGALKNSSLCITSLVPVAGWVILSPCFKGEVASTKWFPKSPPTPAKNATFTLSLGNNSKIIV
jgi:hypothetical protein